MKRLTLFLILLSGMLCAHAQEGADTLAQPAVTAAPEPAAEASPEQLWDRANTAYINGDFHAAAEFYEQILARGLSSMKQGGAAGQVDPFLPPGLAAGSRQRRHPL